MGMEETCSMCKDLNLQYGRDPDCQKCGHMKDASNLLENNIDAFRIWSLVQGQVLMSMDGPIDINHIAVWRDINEYEMEFGQINRWSAFNKIISVYYHFQSERSKEQDINNPAVVANQIEKIKKGNK